MSPLPPGTSHSDPSAPWNEKPVEECERCGGVYTEDGHGTVGGPEQQRCRDCDAYWEGEERDRCKECGSDDIGGEPCPNDGMTMRDLDESQRAARAEQKMEEQRLQELAEE